MKALLLEDDLVRGEHIELILKAHGYRIVWEQSVQGAMRAWQQHVFDLATLDHDLGWPVLYGTGRDFTRWVVQQPGVCRTKFIVHSANIITAPRMVQDLSQAGCSVARVWADSIGMYLDSI